MKFKDLAEKLLNEFKIYVLATALTTAVAHKGYEAYEAYTIRSELEHSNYATKVYDSVSSLYGYDDNKDGKVDRIEEFGVVPLKCGIPAFLIRETHLPNDETYVWYKNRIDKMGVRR